MHSLRGRLGLELCFADLEECSGNHGYVSALSREQGNTIPQYRLGFSFLLQYLNAHPFGRFVRRMV